MKRIGRICAAVLALIVHAPASADFSSGTTWLASQSNADGSLSGTGDVATALQSTSEALSAFATLGVSSQAIPPARGFVALDAYSGTESLARRIIAGVQGSQNVSSLVAELKFHQNADGGFGEQAGFDSSILDTALALEAAALNGFSLGNSAGGAVGYLLQKQKTDGSWQDSSGYSSIYLTALSLRGLWPYRTNFSLSTNVGQARAFLLSQRAGNALWDEPYLSAQALVAILPTLVDRTTVQASVAALEGMQLADGSFEDDVYVTALALRALALGNQPSADEISLRGRVLDGDTQLPLAGVSVSLSGAEGRSFLTDSGGAFDFRALTAGAYRLDLAKNGYGALTSDTTLAPGDAIDFGDLAMLTQTGATTGTLRGVVSDYGNGQPISGATITASSVVAQSGSDGSYQISNVPAGSMTVAVSASGYGTASATASIPAGGVAVFSPRLTAGSQESGGVLLGTIRDAQTDQPLTDVAISVTGSSAGSATTDSAGNYRITALAGTISITVAKSGYDPISTSTSIAGNVTVTFSPKLYGLNSTPAGANTTTITGLVVDSSTGDPLPGVTVSVKPTSGAHRYWRIYMTAVNNVQGVLMEVEFRDHYGGADRAVGGTPSASSANPGFTSSSAFDDNFGTYWNTSGSTAPPHWIAYQFAQPIEVVEYSLTACECNADYSPRTWQLQYSDNGTSWSVADSRSGQSFRGLTRVYGVGQSLQTDSQGRFAASGFSASEVTMSFASAGHVPVEFNFPLPLADSVDFGAVRLRRLGLDQLLPDLTVPSVSVAGGATSDPQSLVVAASITATVHNDGDATAAGNLLAIAFYDADGDATFDTSVDTELGRAQSTASITAGADAEIGIALSGQLPFRDAPISVWIDAASEAPEINEANNVGATSASCRVSPATGELTPALKWHWNGSPSLPSAVYVFGPPAVAQFNDDNGDGAINQSDVPDMVFSAGTTSSGSGSSLLTVVSGADGHELWARTDIPVTYLGSPSVADIDGDGLVEIVMTDRGRTRLYAFENTGVLKFNVATGPQNWATPADNIAIADLDHDGAPELINGSRVFSSTGVLLWAGTGDTTGPTDLVGYGYLPIAADVDLAGNMEVIAGRTVYTSSGQILWHRRELPADGYNAVGNFDQDDYPEIVLVSMGRVFLLEHTGATKWSATLPGGGRGGPPTIADVDGDGQPEIGVAGRTAYTVFETDGSIKWSTTVQDLSSNVTGSSVFDFEGDGRAEIAYADELNLRIYDGRTGQVRVQIPNTSGTTLEYPLIVDVDGDSYAELVLTSNPSGSGPTTSGVRVYKAQTGHWAATRSIWNEHSYHITNINDDGTVPRNEQPSWLAHNTYRLNTFLDHNPLDSADVTAGYLRIIDSGGGQPVTLVTRIGNAGLLAPVSTTPVVFYEGDPASGGRLLGTTSVASLAPGTSTDVMLSGVTGLDGVRDIHIVVDPQNALTECGEGNNAHHIPFRTESALGSITVSTDAPSYGPDTDAILLSASVNSGSFPDTFTAELQILDIDGVEVTHFGPTAIETLSAGTSASFDQTWNTGRTINGSYRLKGILRRNDGALVDEDIVSFSIGSGTSQNASLRASTDRPTYHTTDRVQIDNLARNLTTNYTIAGARLHVTVLGPTGQTTLSLDVALGDLRPNSLQERALMQALDAAPLGTYQVLTGLFDGGGQQLATAGTVYEVRNDLGMSITGSVAAEKADLGQGESQSCIDTIGNRGAQNATALQIRQTIARLDQDQTLAQATVTVDVIAGGSVTLSRGVNTADMDGGDYTCALEAYVDGAWNGLGYAVFHVTAEPISLTTAVTTDRPVYETSGQAQLNATVRSLTTYRTVRGATLHLDVATPDGTTVFTRDSALADLAPGSITPAQAIHAFSNAPEGIYTVRDKVLLDSAIVASADTTYQVKKGLDVALTGAVTAQKAEVQPGDVQTCTDTLNNSSIYSLSGVQVRQVLSRTDQPQVITTTGSTQDVPAQGSATLTRVFSTTNLARGDYACVVQALVAAQWEQLGSAAFKVTAPPIRIDAELAMGSKGRLLVLLDPPANNGDQKDPLGPAVAAAPLLNEQRTYLENLLRREGWSFKIVTDAAAFTTEFRSGAYSVYALLSETVKLDEQFQKEFREAIYRGEGLFEAGGHDERNNKLDEALGVKVAGKSTKPTGIDLLVSAVSTGGHAEYPLADKTLRTALTGAQSQGYTADTGLQLPVVTTFDYGDGQSVFGGFDLLLQATKSGAGLFSELLTKAPAYVQPPLEAKTSRVVPITLTLTNEGIATAGRVVFTLPSGSVVEDAGAAVITGAGELTWNYTLPASGTAAVTFWLRLPAQEGTATVHASVQVGEAGSYSEQTTADLTFNVVRPPGVDNAIAATDPGNDGAFDLEKIKDTDISKVRDQVDLQTMAQVREDLEDAQAAIQQGDYEAALGFLVHASDELALRASAKANEIRRMIADALFEVGQQLP
jgi:hypothetical protein